MCSTLHLRSHSTQIFWMTKIIKIAVSCDEGALWSQCEKQFFPPCNNKVRQETIWLTSLRIKNCLFRCSVFSACLSFSSSSRSYEQKNILFETGWSFPSIKDMPKREKERRRNINYLDFHKLLEKTAMSKPVIELLMSNSLKLCLKLHLKLNT